MNRLYFGDNLIWLRNPKEFPDESVDLVYLDPPFNSNADYNVLFRETSGQVSQAQFHAFTDTWSWADAAETYHQFIDSCPNVAVVELMEALQSFLKHSPMMAYLAMMAPRLVELHRVLKPTGSLYLHCDPTASHYLRMLLDGIFDAKNFVNEIVWRRYGAHNDVGQGSSHFGRVHDVLLLYRKTDVVKWNQIFVPLSDDYVKETYRHVEPETGRRFTTTPLTGPGGAQKGNPVFEWKGHTRAWRYSKDTMERLDKEGRLSYSGTGYVRQKKYLQESKGVPVQDWWDDVKALTGANAERLGYQTQKPLALLERIISASSNPGDVVLDPFCGCGTTIHAAQKLGRKWIGIDVTYLAINLIKRRLKDAFGEEIAFEERGQPTDFESAKRLAELDKFQFQHWALSLVGARPLKEGDGKGADRGVDGLLYFYDLGSAGASPAGSGASPEQASGPAAGKVARGRTTQRAGHPRSPDENEPALGGLSNAGYKISDAKREKIIVQVKGGGVQRNDVATLLGDINNQKAAAGVLITLDKPTKPMRGEAIDAGRYTSNLWHEKDYPRIQLLTIEGLLNGTERIDAPPQINPFAMAAREKSGHQQTEML